MFKPRELLAASQYFVLLLWRAGDRPYLMLCNCPWQERVWVTGDLPIHHVQKPHDSEIVEHLKADVAALERKLREVQVRMQFAYLCSEFLDKKAQLFRIPPFYRSCLNFRRYTCRPYRPRSRVTLETDLQIQASKVTTTHCSLLPSRYDHLR